MKINEMAKTVHCINNIINATDIKKEVEDVVTLCYELNKIKLKLLPIVDKCKDDESFLRKAAAEIDKDGKPVYISFKTPQGNYKQLKCKDELLEKLDEDIKKLWDTDVAATYEKLDSSFLESVLKHLEGMDTFTYMDFLSKR